MVIAIILAVLLLIAAIALVVTVIFQSNGKSAKLSGSIAGGSTDTFLGKNKQYARDRKLVKMTTILAIVFVVLVLVTSIYTARFLSNKSSEGTGSTTSAATDDSTASSESATGSAAESATAEVSGEEEAPATESDEAAETEDAGEEAVTPVEDTVEPTEE